MLFVDLLYSVAQGLLGPIPIFGISIEPQVHEAELRVPVLTLFGASFSEIIFGF